jgi:GTP pyrophosphokinase
VPDEPIVGFVTRGRGVSVHRANCEEGKAIMSSEPERQVEVSWSQSSRGLYQVSIEIDGRDRSGFLNDVTRILAEMDVAMASASARAYKSGAAKVQVRIEIKDVSYLNAIMARMRKINGVEEVRRV